MRCGRGWWSLAAHRRCELGQPHRDLRPRAHTRLDRQPMVVAEGGAKPLVDVAQPDRLAAGPPREHVREVPWIDADAVVLDRDDGLVAAVFRGDLQPGGSREPLEAMPDSVF